MIFQVSQDVYFMHCDHFQFQIFKDVAMYLPFTVIICIIILSAALISIVVFGNSPNFRNTQIYKLRIKILQWNHDIIAWINHIDSQIFGNKLLYYSGWLVPFFYISVVTFCLHQFFTKVYDLLPLSLRTNKFHSAYIAFTIMSIFMNTFMTTFSDPGKITSGNVEEVDSFFHNNELIFFGANYCSTCETIKPARSKHCSVCNCCIMLFDHHCIWVNNCIGYYNYKWFMGFLIANINLLSYGGYLCYQAMSTARAAFPTLSYWKTIVSTNNSNKATGILLILCVIFIMIVILFTGLHLRYLYLGVTTNECDKWSEVEYLVDLGSLYQIVDNTLNEKYVEKCVIMNHNNDSYETVFISLKNEKVLSSDDGIVLRKIESVEDDLFNIYDHGFVDNLKERIFNRTFY